MNRITLIALCAAGTWATSAGAQSAVSVSGIVDAAARHVSNDGVGSIRSLVSGSNSTSRLVFSGREDLGGALAAGFHLEHGFLVDAGTPASADKFWDRRSTVSLSSAAMGELRLGRDFVPSYVAWSRYDPFSYVGVARSANLVSATPAGPIRSAFSTNANTTVRSDNAAQWLAPAGLAGFEAGLMIAAREGGDAASGRAGVRGARVGYAAKSFSVSAAAARTENSLTSAGSFQDKVVGGHVDVADVRLSGAWREFRQSQATQRLLMLGAVATFGQHEVKASWVKADMSGRAGTVSIDGTGADQCGLGYVYNLSKRTAMYATVARIGNDGLARYVISDGPAGMAAGGTSRGYEAGIRHRF
ncbi:porin [Aquincola sp. S2]|uniref:Porin n=1 Tax=Pseudaquabacterium terrae TaxID=2732868 RepID=A0ABX2EG49_9BURK|nr:porin [Aquabacterium terrae]NRF67561.1 porin [Aquabacterium terrae]